MSLIASVLLLLLPVSLQNDDVVLAKMEEYLAAIDYLEIPAAQMEVDFMISSVADSTLREKVAVGAYKHFRNSKVMGSENVAVHIFDNWFANFNQHFDTLDEYEEAEFYAFINRQSLIGATAATIEMNDENGLPVTFPAMAEKSIIYFYTTGCPKCLYTSLKLREFLQNRDEKIEVFAIYTGSDQIEWRKYIEIEFNLPSDCKSVIKHLNAEDADFVVQYGVIQTPRLFLVDENGVVVGRNLDVEALSRLL